MGHELTRFKGHLKRKVNTRIFSLKGYLNLVTKFKSLDIKSVIFQNSFSIFSINTSSWKIHL